MKKAILMLAMVICCGMISAQEVVTYSAYDTDLDRDVDIADVTNTTARVLQRISDDPQLMKAEDVVEALNRVDNSLNEIKNMLSFMQTHPGQTYVDLGDYEYVDLGLPSGTLWATVDLGSNAIGVPGGKYAWGEVTPKTEFFEGNWAYTTMPTFTDEIDAAYVATNGKWQMPTADQVRELTNAEYTIINTKDTYNGYPVVSITSRINGNTLYLCRDLADGNASKSAAYWTRTNVNSKLCYVLFNNSLYNRVYPYEGLNIRPVLTAQLTENVQSNLPNPVTAVALSETTVAMKTGEVVTLAATVMPANAKDPSLSWYSTNPAVATVNDNGVVTAVGVGSATIVAVANGGSNISAACNVSVSKANSPGSVDGVDHEYVDLGLPSGTLWATCNVGADSPGELGYLLAWGETEPKSSYTAENYFDSANSTGGAYKKYGYYKVELDPEDDAATQLWGSDWRMPTYEEIQELHEHANKITLEGKTMKLTFGNGRCLYFRLVNTAISTYAGGMVFVEDTYLWARDLLDSNNARALSLQYYNTSYLAKPYYRLRYNSAMVRPVYVGAK